MTWPQGREWEQGAGVVPEADQFVLLHPVFPPLSLPQGHLVNVSTRPCAGSAEAAISGAQGAGPVALGAGSEDISPCWGGVLGVCPWVQQQPASPGDRGPGLRLQGRGWDHGVTFYLKMTCLILRALWPLGSPVKDQQGAAECRCTGFSCCGQA